MSAKEIIAKADQAEKLAIRMQQLLSSDGRLTAEVAATWSEVEMEMAAVIFQQKEVEPQILEC